MKVTILGAGVGACVPNTATEKLTPPGFLAEWENQKLLFECSEGIRFRLEDAGHPIESIQHLAISHSHPDHYCLPQFLQGIHLKGAWGGEKHKSPGIAIYCSKTIASQYPQLRSLYWNDMDPHSYLDEQIYGLEDGSVMTIKNAKLIAYHAYHDYGKLDALSYRLETPEGIVAYSGDTGLCEGINAIAKDADLFICEASSPVNDDSIASNYGHLNAKQAAEIALKQHAKKLVLFHYSGKDSDEDLLASAQSSGYKGEIIIAKDKMILEV